MVEEDGMLERNDDAVLLSAVLLIKLLFRARKSRKTKAYH